MTNEVVTEARRVAKALGWHPTATPCQCWNCQAERSLKAAADEIERLSSKLLKIRTEWQYGADKDALYQIAIDELNREPDEPQKPMTNEQLADEFLKEHQGWQRLEKICVKDFAKWLDQKVSVEPTQKHQHAFKEVNRPSVVEGYFATHACACGIELCLPKSRT